MAKKAGVYHDTGGWLRLSFPYDATVKDQIKGVVGRGNYRYEPKEKTWYILEPFAQDAINIFSVNGYEIETDLPVGQSSTPDASPSPSNSTSPFTLVFAEAMKVSPDLGEKLYRALAKVCHPDVGGSNQLMSWLNQGYQEMQERRMPPW